MAVYYFTLGFECGHPFDGGWVEVQADSEKSACDAFTKRFGLGKSGLIRCAGIYDENSFRRTGMDRLGNFWKFCHERIVVNET